MASVNKYIEIHIYTYQTTHCTFSKTEWLTGPLKCTVTPIWAHVANTGYPEQELTFRPTSSLNITTRDWELFERQSVLTCSRWALMVCSFSWSRFVISCCSLWLCSWWSVTDDCILLISFSSFEMMRKKEFLNQLMSKCFAYRYFSGDIYLILFGFMLTFNVL